MPSLLQIRHEAQDKCLIRPGGRFGGSVQPTGTATLKECVIEVYPPQTFVFNKRGEAVRGTGERERSEGYSSVRKRNRGRIGRHDE